MRYFIENPNSRPIALSTGEVISPHAFFDRVVSLPELEAMRTDFNVHGLKLYLAGPDGQMAVSGQAPPSAKQRKYYRLLTGENPPPGMTREQLGQCIQDMLIERQQAESEAEPRSRPKGLQVKTTKQQHKPTGPSVEILSGKVVAVQHERFDPLRDLGRATIFVSLSDEPIPTGDMRPDIHLHWNAQDNVNEWVLAGLVRFCAAAARGDGQRVVLVGTWDAIQVVSACILREYLGCDSKTALSLLRTAGAPGLTASALLASVDGYPLS